MDQAHSRRIYWLAFYGCWFNIHPIMTFVAQPVSAGAEPLVGQRSCLVPVAEAKSHAFVISHYRERTFHFVWHFHPEIELVWIRRGCGLRYAGTGTEAFEAGDLVLVYSAPRKLDRWFRW